MFGIDDAIIGQVAGSALGGLFGGDGGSATQTASKEPWAKAAPWIEYNLGQGQKLQNYYEQNPFGAVQQAAFKGLLGGNDYINAALPGLLAQFSQPVGYNMSNPQARPAPIRFPAMAQGTTGGATAGLLGADMNVSMNPFRNGGIQAPAAAPAPAQTALPPLWFDPTGSQTGEGFRAIQQSYANGDNRF